MIRYNLLEVFMKRYFQHTSIKFKPLIKIKADDQSVISKKNIRWIR